MDNRGPTKDIALSFLSALPNFYEVTQALLNPIIFQMMSGVPIPPIWVCLSATLWLAPPQYQHFQIRFSE
jgi:hypothetical protein